MNNGDTHPGDAPTRAIHDSYLDLQRALKTYRRAKDAGNQPSITAAHGDVQDAVLTFYQLLRPHLRNSKAVQGYWHGQPPNYSNNGEPPDPNEGKGVLHVQRRNKRHQMNGTNSEDVETLDKWHDIVELSDDVRLVGVQTNGEIALVHYDAYQLGLKQLDDWETEYVTKQTTIGGFMGSKGDTEKERVRVDMQRLNRAANELAEAADELGFLSHTDVPTNTDPTPI